MWPNYRSRRLRRRGGSHHAFTFSIKPWCGHFTLLFCRGRQRNVPKFIMHLQSLCFFFFFFIKTIVFWRSRCSRQRKRHFLKISSCYLHYFQIVPIRLTVNLAIYPVTEQVGTAFKLKQRVKNLPSSRSRSPQKVLVISRCCSAECGEEMYQKL